MNQPSALARLRRFSPLLLVLVSAATAIAAYLQALDYPFIFDDEYYITKNAKLAELHLTELWMLFTEPHTPFYEFFPLRDLSYWFDMTLFGLNPSAFRLHNILLYLLCLPLVYATTLELWRYFRPADAASAPWAAATVTSLFALHPALVESVVWISMRKYVLPNLFSMLALWFAVRARRAQGLSAPNAAATLVAFVAVMLSKTPYITVAPIIALLWLIFWLDIPKSDRRRSLLLWPLAILILAVFLFLLSIVRSAGGTGNLDSIPFYFGVKAITRTLAALGWLARLAVSPESRHFFYPVFEDPYLPAMVALGGAVLAASVAGGVMLLRERSLEGFAVVAFLLLCVPYIHLIPYSVPSLVSDHFLALATWPAVLLIVALCWRLKPIPRTVLSLIIVLPWSFQTAARTHDWRSFETVIDADLRAYPGYYMPAVYKITAIQLPQGLLHDAGKTASSIADPEIRNIMIGLIKDDHAVRVDAVATGKPQEAMGLLWKWGLDLKQRPIQAKWNSPINNIWTQRRFVLAIEWDYLAEHFPDDVSVRYNAGLWMLSAHKYKGAVAHLRAATESQRLPESMRGTAFKNLGLALLYSGHTAEAETPLRAALERSPPDLRAYCLLSNVYEQTGRLDEAARAEANCHSSAPSEKTEQ